MLSSTFNSPNALCYCHPHFKEKLIERFAADGLRNLPDPRASKQKSQNSSSGLLPPSLSGDLNNAVGSLSLGGCQRTRGRGCERH